MILKCVFDDQRRRKRNLCPSKWVTNNSFLNPTFSPTRSSRIFHDHLPALETHRATGEVSRLVCPLSVFPFLRRSNDFSKRMDSKLVEKSRCQGKDRQTVSHSEAKTEL